MEKSNNESVSKKETPQRRKKVVKVTALQVAGALGIESSAQTWLKKRYASSSPKTIKEWCDILVNEKVLSQEAADSRLKSLGQ